MDDTAGRDYQLDSSTNKLLSGSAPINPDELTIGEDITGVNRTKNAVKSSASGKMNFDGTPSIIEEEKK